MQEVPASWRATQTQRQLVNVTAQIQQDIDAAQSLPDSPANPEAGPETLLIQTPQGVIRYVLAGGQLTRDLPGSQDPPKKWQMPDAVLTWKRVPDSAAAQGLEVHSAVGMHIGGKTVERLAVNRLYYLHALGSAKGKP